MLGLEFIILGRLYQSVGAAIDKKHEIHMTI